MPQQFSNASQATEKTGNDDTYEGTSQQTANFPQRTDRSQAPTLDLERTGQNGRVANGAGREGSLLRDPEKLRQHWESIQVGFVDNPREAVGEAEDLVSSTIGQIANVFRQQRERLEASWAEGREPSTDDLRAAFQSYRDFFGRLLQV